MHAIYQVSLAFNKGVFRVCAAEQGLVDNSAGGDSSSDSVIRGHRPVCRAVVHIHGVLMLS